MTPEVLFTLLLALVGAALQLAREAVRRHAARRVEETRSRAMVELAGHCGPDAVLVDHRCDGTTLTVRTGAAVAPAGDRPVSGNPHSRGRGQRRA
ncbi:hypothetical protein [Streptomyces yangpuensis]|uniref:hypothetical protein n=1 Tax=Streptomyces yangpuensis TaxID=1648182 RepID=UPI0006297384|nr:hypothetical protein [Streptomyces yangpuensis]